MRFVTYDNVCYLTHTFTYLIKIKCECTLKKQSHIKLLIQWRILYMFFPRKRKIHKKKKWIIDEIYFVLTLHYYCFYSYITYIHTHIAWHTKCFSYKLTDIPSIMITVFNIKHTYPHSPTSRMMMTSFVLYGFVQIIKHPKIKYMRKHFMYVCVCVYV